MEIVEEIEQNEDNVLDPAERYIDRDVSWLSFNYRVLWEAKDESLPLYERIKFLAIFSSNMDEFFRVRVASIRSLLKVKKKKRKKLGISPKETLNKIHAEVTRQQEEFGSIFRDQIQPALMAHNIHLLRSLPQDPGHKSFVRDYFQRKIMPFVHPEVLMKGRIAHFLRDQALYLALRITRKREFEFGDSGSISLDVEKSIYAIVLIPTHYFPRFIQMPRDSEVDPHTIMFLDDIIRDNLDLIFPGFNIKECYSIKLSRDADLKLDEEIGVDLAEHVKRHLDERQIGAPARFLYDQRMPEKMLKYLCKTFNIDKSDSIPGGTYHNFSDFFGFPNPLKPKLQLKPLPQLPHKDIDAFDDIFAAIRAKDRILHFPYQRYDYFINMLNLAAVDPQVTEIKATQYRVASNSGVVNAMINAARNGKKVTVFVEIKARFDEESNLKSVEDMREAGVKVIYQLPKLTLDGKLHAKVAWIKREEEEKTRYYSFFSTGNFNEKTAKFYCDHGLLTCDPRLTEELGNFFVYLEDFKLAPSQFKHLLVAQFNLKDAFLEMIEREIRNAREGKKAYIMIKVNNLEERDMIDKLYEASQAGVKIDMIVRSICSLRPGKEGLSEISKLQEL